MVVIAALKHDGYFCFLFTCVLLNDTVGGSGCVAANVETVDEWWNEKDVERNDNVCFLRKVFYLCSRFSGQDWK
jgi:hypothetical protein